MVFSFLVKLPTQIASQIDSSCLGLGHLDGCSPYLVHLHNFVLLTPSVVSLYVKEMQQYWEHSRNVFIVLNYSRHASVVTFRRLRFRTPIVSTAFSLAVICLLQRVLLYWGSIFVFVHKLLTIRLAISRRYVRVSDQFVKWQTIQTVQVSRCFISLPSN